MCSLASKIIVECIPSGIHFMQDHLVISASVKTMPTVNITRIMYNYVQVCYVMNVSQLA